MLPREIISEEWIITLRKEWQWCCQRMEIGSPQVITQNRWQWCSIHNLKGNRVIIRIIYSNNNSKWMQQHILLCKVEVAVVALTTAMPIRIWLQYTIKNLVLVVQRIIIKITWLFRKLKVQKEWNKSYKITRMLWCSSTCKDWVEAIRILKNSLVNSIFPLKVL